MMSWGGGAYGVMADTKTMNCQISVVLPTNFWPNAV